MNARIELLALGVKFRTLRDEATIISQHFAF